MADSKRRDLVWQKGAATGWTSEMRLVGAYLLSGPRSNRIGCFAFDVAEASEQTGLSDYQIDKIIETLEGEDFVRFDRSSGWIWIPGVLRQNPFADAEEVRRTLGDLAAVPREAGFRADLMQLFRQSADHPGGKAQTPAQNGSMSDYLRRCREYLNSLVDTRALRLLGTLTIVLAILFVVFPAIDLGVAGWFFVPPRSFTLGETWIGRFFDSDIHFGMEWFLPVIVALFVYGLIRKKPIWNLTPRNFLFVALSIGLGAGLVTNVILKDSWGRARPSQVLEFGGTKQFSPPFMRSTQCDKNCSFVSGDASLAASFLSFAVIAQRYRRRWWAGLGTFTVVVGVMRMGRGSHFLSDVVFAIIFTLMIMLVLKQLILEDRWRKWPKWREDMATTVSLDEGL
jgi:lipid A 4'-phosphatase